MSTTALEAVQLKPGALLPGGKDRLPPILWRDPHSVPPEQLAEVITSLEAACAMDPDNPDLRTCLGIVHAMNYDPYRSMDALEEARRIAPDNFMAQAKYAELYFRLRALEKAEEETHRALALASNGWEVALMRRQLSEIRQMLRQGTIKPMWTKSLALPAIGLGAFVVFVSWLFLVYR